MPAKRNRVKDGGIIEIVNSDWSELFRQNVNYLRVNCQRFARWNENVFIA